MKVSISDITVSDRVRKDMGDLTPLMDSLDKHGLISPVVVNEDLVLVAGHRRLQSAKKLGWSEIEVIITHKISEEDLLEIELSENVYRKDFSPLELLEGYTRFERLKKPTFWEKVRRFFRKLFKLES
ncbi:MAG: ParB N-terminal domain-containing protein [Kiritimatiellae bacterium]|jgi:ParB family chromosome partitioning protein|nr:ParB N-terminal domain-containing protein [Kiritimatiellia bacterium]